MTSYIKNQVNKYWVYMRIRDVGILLIAGSNWNNAGNTGVSNWNSNNDTSNTNANISTRLELRGILSSSEQHIYPDSLNELNMLLSPGGESNKFVNSLPERRS